VREAWQRLPHFARLGLLCFVHDICLWMHLAAACLRTCCLVLCNRCSCPTLACKHSLLCLTLCREERIESTTASGPGGVPGGGSTGAAGTEPAVNAELDGLERELQVRQKSGRAVLHLQQSRHGGMLDGKKLLLSKQDCIPSANVVPHQLGLMLAPHPTQPPIGCSQMQELAAAGRADGFLLYLLGLVLADRCGTCAASAKALSDVPCIGHIPSIATDSHHQANGRLCVCLMGLKRLLVGLPPATAFTGSTVLLDAGRRRRRRGRCWLPR